MTAARRYRVALRAYPRGYRSKRGSELLATLADGDDDRGRPSTREATALAYRGLVMRARLAASPEGLLVASAALLLLAVTGGLTWAERVVPLHGNAAAGGSDGPGLWWTLAIGVSALTTIAAGPFGVLGSPRRRAVTVLLACPLAMAVFTQPGRIFYAGLPDAATVAEFLEWLPAAVFHNWAITLPASLASMLGTWIALRALERLNPPGRHSALAAALAILGTVAVAQAWQRPDLAAEYGRSAYADLGPATFVAALGLLLAMAALWRTRPQAATRRPARR